MPALEDLGSQEILEAFIQGDRNADRILIDRLWTYVITCARKAADQLSRAQSFGGISLDPEEATNQALAEFLEQRTRDDQSFRMFDWIRLTRYLGRRAVLRIIDQDRRRRAGHLKGGGIKSLEDLVRWAQGDQDPKPLDPPSEGTPESFHKLHLCLDRLTPTEREMFQSKHLDETTQAELALEYKMPQGTVAVQLMRIAVRLRECLKRGGMTRFRRFQL